MGRLAVLLSLMLRTGWVVIRRTVRVSSPRSMVIVSAAT
jgi:hypothetical protein